MTSRPLTPEDRADAPDVAFNQIYLGEHVVAIASPCEAKQPPAERRIEPRLDAERTIGLYQCFDRAPQRARQQIVSHLFRDGEGDAFLRLGRRSTEMRRGDYFIE